MRAVVVRRGAFGVALNGGWLMPTRLGSSVVEALEGHLVAPGPGWPGVLGEMWPRLTPAANDERLPLGAA